MIKFTKIILEDCFAFEYQEFDFTSGIHSVNGVNGASKTSIYLALAQGLFNKNPKGVKIDDVSNYVTKRPYEITIFFTKGTDEYKVVNSRKKSCISVEINGKPISRKTIPQNLELIREILEDTYENFVGGSYQSSDSTLDLLEESGDTARKNFINKILKFDELDELLAHTKDKIKNLKTSLKRWEDQRDFVATQFIALKVEEEPIDTKPLADVVETLEELRNAALLACANAKADVEAQESKMQAYNKYQQNVRRIEEIEGELYDTHPNVSAKDAEKEFDLISKELTKCESIYKTAKAKLKELVEPESVCSRCGHELDALQAMVLYQKDKAKLESEIKDSSEAAKPLAERSRYLQLTISAWKRRAELIAQRKMIKGAMVVAEVADSSTLAAASQKYEEAQKAYQTASQDHAEALQKLTAATRHNDLVTMVKQINSQAAAANAITECKLNDIAQEIGAVEKRLDTLDNWSRILGANGYRVHSMKSFLAVLNHTMDKYADIISGGRIKCSFFVTDEGKIDFTVVDPDKKVPFSNWSKGEQARVKLACLFSVIELLEVKGAASYNVLVLDEIFSALDDEGKEGLFDVLSYLRSKGKCIYTISHTPLVNPVVFDSTIEVVKANGLAKIM